MDKILMNLNEYFINTGFIFPNVFVRFDFYIAN